MRHMMDLMHWQTYPGAGLLGPTLVMHWRVMRAFKACISPINISTFASDGTRCESTSRQQWPSSTSDSPPSKPSEDSGDISNLLIFLNLCQLCSPWGVTHALSLKLHPWEYSRKVRSSEPYQRDICVVWCGDIYKFWLHSRDFPAKLLLACR